MADVFTPEISYGPWSVGMMQPDLPGLGYRTVQSATPVATPAWVLGSGYWNDSNIWSDSETWRDAA